MFLKLCNVQSLLKEKISHGTPEDKYSKTLMYIKFCLYKWCKNFCKALSLN